MSSITYHPNAANKWFSCDFQVAYDPCVCYFPSSLQINFFAVENQDLELHGRQISIEQNLITGKAINQKDFLSNFDYTGSTADGGMIMYKAMDYLVDDYEAKIDAYRAKLAQVNEHNKELDRYAFVIKAFKSIVLSGGSSLVSSVLNSAWIGDLSNQVNEFYTVEFGNDTVADTLIDVEKIKKSAKSALSKEINTFFTENFKKQDLPAAPASPTATFSEMHFQGQLTKDTDLDGPYFYTPGTYGSEGTGSPPLTEFNKYPIYNEALGVFALLESPKILKSKKSEVEIPNPNLIKVTNRLQFKLKDDLKYTFNPTLNIVKKDISAMYIFKVINNATPLTPAFNFKVFDNSVNLLSDKINTYTNQKLYEFVNPNISTSYFAYKKDTVEYNSGFIPLDAFKNMVIELGTIEEQISDPLITDFFQPYSVVDTLTRSIWSKINIQLKLMIDVTYAGTHENGALHEYTYVFTYDIKEGNIELSNVELYPNLANSIGDINQFNENLTFGNTTFDGSQINGCKLVGNTYTCQAWDEILINGNINVNNGYNVNFLAGNLITVNPESIITPQSLLAISPVLNFSDPMPESDFTYVKGFCKGTNTNAPSYLANLPTKRILDLEANNVQNEEEFEESMNWDFSLYPNPTTSDATVILSGYNKTNYSIEVSDMTGKLICSKVNTAETSQSVLELNGISKGVYFVKVNTLQGTKMKQLVIQ